MTTFYEDAGKDARYFPNDSETPILIHYLKVYFSHPERSVQRAQVVQNVVSILSKNNGHWNHRTVRLWFNNNKRVFYNPTTPPNQSPIQERVDPPAHYTPQRKYYSVPPRPLSVVQFPHSADGSPSNSQDDTRNYQPKASYPEAQLVLPVPKPGSFAESIQKELAMISEKTDIILAQREIEEHLTEKIVQINDEKWGQTMTFPNIKKVIDNSIMSKENFADEEKIPTNIIDVAQFELIETGLLADDGKSLMVCYDTTDETQKLFMNDQCTDTELYSPITSLVYDEYNEQFWVHADSMLRSFSAYDLSKGRTINVPSRKSFKSVMTFWSGKLALATGSTIITFDPADLMEEAEEQKFEKCYTQILHAITSVAPVAYANKEGSNCDYLVVASQEHHTSEVFADNGAVVLRAIGHTGGITALASYDQDKFLSGSADQTTKLWDIRSSTPAMNLLKHQGIVTAIKGYPKDSLVLTGGTDGMIKGWDLRTCKHLFSTYVGPSAPTSISYDSRSQQIAVIVSERTADNYFDLGRFGPTIMQDQQRYSPNALIHIQLTM